MDWQAIRTDENVINLYDWLYDLFTNRTDD